MNKKLMLGLKSKLQIVGWLKMNIATGKNPKNKAVRAVTQTAYVDQQSNNNNLLKEIKDKFQSGQSLKLIDYPESERSSLISVIAKLRDELPIKAKWQTIRESHVSETRLRAISYSIPCEFLRDDVDE